MGANDKDFEDIDINKASNPKAEEQEKKKKEKNKKTQSQDIGSSKKVVKRIIWIVIILIIAAAFFFYARSNAKKMERELAMASNRAVETAQVMKRDITTAINATGVVEAQTVRTLTSTAKDTTIEMVGAEVGDYVQAGDIMVTFSQEKIRKQIDDVKKDINRSAEKDKIEAKAKEREYMYSFSSEAATLTSAAEKVEQALEDLYEACDGYGDEKRKLEEIKGSDYENEDIKKNAIEAQENVVASAYQREMQAQRAYDAAVEAQANANRQTINNLTMAEEKYDTTTISAGTTTEDLRRKLEEYQDNLDGYVITAPIDGIVTSVKVEEGNGFSGGEVMVIQNTDMYKIKSQIDEYDIPDIKVGQKVVIKTDATRDKELEGVVSFISPTSSAASTSSSSAQSSSGSSATYAVEIDIITKDERLMIGMSAKLNIIVDQVSNVLTVPYDAIVEDFNGVSTVCVVENAKEMGYTSVDEDEILPDGMDVENVEKNSEIPHSADFVSETTTAEENIEKIKNSKNSKREQETVVGKIKALFAKDEAEDEIPVPKQHNVTVQIGAEGDYYTQVISNELKEGMTVLIQNEEEESFNFPGFGPRF